MSDLIRRLGDALVEAAERQAAQAPRGWRGRLRWPRRASSRALVLVSAAVLAGAGGTAGVLATRGEVGGPPTLTFGRVSPQQQRAGIRATTRPVIFARGQLPVSDRRWQLVGFTTTRGFCIDVDWPETGSSGGCGTNRPKQGGLLDWQGQIPLHSRRHGVIVGAIDPTVASVQVSSIESVRRLRRIVSARVIHVTDQRTLNAMGLREPFAYYVAELPEPFFAMRAAAYDAHGNLLQRIGIPDDMVDTPGGGFDVPGSGCDLPNGGRQPSARLVHTLPPAAARDVLAPLRRPQRPTDLPPRASRGVLASSFAATVEIGAVRRLGPVPGGGALYLIPGTQRIPQGPGAGCLRTLTPAGRAYEDRRDALIRKNTSGLRYSAIVVGPNNSGGGAGLDLPDIESPRSYASLGHLAFSLLPDGVAHVDLTFSHAIHRSLDVHDNYWATTLPTSAGATRLLTATWRSADGHVIKRMGHR